MSQGTDLETFRVRVQEYMSHIYFDTQSCAPITNKANEDYVIKLISRFVVSICSVWYAIQEIIDFLRKRKVIKGFSS